MKIFKKINLRRKNKGRIDLGVKADSKFYT